MNNENNKILLKVYVEEGRYYIDRDMASAFGLVKSMPLVNNAPKVIEISDYLFEHLKNNKSLNVEISSKFPIKVFADGGDRCVSLSDAYSLGLLGDDEYFGSKSSFYYISNEILAYLYENYNVELVLMNTNTNNCVRSI